MFSKMITLNRCFETLAYSLLFGYAAEVFPNYAKSEGISICAGVVKLGS